MFAIIGNANAQDKIYVDDVKIPEGGSTVVAINILSEERSYIAFQVDIKLPAGISASNAQTANRFPQEDSEGNEVEVSKALKKVDAANNIYNLIVYNSANAEMSGTDGAVVYLTLTADESLAAGTEIADGVLSGGVLSTLAQKYRSEDSTFGIEIVDYVLLDETSPVMPVEAEGVKVQVKRTITAGEWCTLCLPVDLWGDDVEAIFGANAKFATFTGYTKDGGTPSARETKTAQTIKLNFTSEDWVSNDGIMANTPYLVKSENDVEVFTLEDAAIVPNENVDVQVKQNGTTGRVCGHFYGTEYAGKYVPENGLFLSGGNFYYSKGKTVIKGFRGYFVLNDILADLASSAGVKMEVNVDDATVIEGVPELDTEGTVFTIDGKKMNNDATKLPKGVYIIDGKKVAIK